MTYQKPPNQNSDTRAAALETEISGYTHHRLNHQFTDGIGSRGEEKREDLGASLMTRNVNQAVSVFRSISSAETYGPIDITLTLTRGDRVRIHRYREHNLRQLHCPCQKPS